MLIKPIIIKITKYISISPFICCSLPRVKYVKSQESRVKYYRRPKQRFNEFLVLAEITRQFQHLNMIASLDPIIRYEREYLNSHRS